MARYARRMRATAVVAAAALAAFSASEAAAADAVRKTAPLDLSSNGIGWRQDNPSGDNTGFMKVPGDTGPGPIMSHPDWPYKQNVVNRVGDFTHPALTPWARGLLEQRARKVMAGGLPFVPNSRCFPGGVPGLHFFPANVFFLQTEKETWFLNARGEVRRIFMNVPHRTPVQYSWYGDSVGHYEGKDTLVVDTIGLDDKGPIDRYNTPHTRQLHVIERFQLSPQRKLVVTVTMEDPGAFTMPLKGMIQYSPATGGRGRGADWEEYSCNENSREYFIPDDQLVPVPAATKRDF